MLITLAIAACAHHAPSPTASPALLSAPQRDTWSFQGHPGTLITTHSYRLYSTSTDPTLLERLPDFLERSLDAYTSALGPLPRPTLHLDTFLMADRRQWEALTRQLMGNQSATYLKIERGGFASGGRAALFPLGPRDTLAIAAHEGWHQYTQRTFKSDLPPWLEEGIATYMEGIAPDPADPTRFVFAPSFNPERLDQLRRASNRGQLLPLDQLLSTTPQSLIDASPDAALTYYAQVWALTRFLRETNHRAHAPALATLLSNAARGQLAHASSPDTFTRSFGDAAAAARDYKAFIADLLAGRD